MGGQAEGQTEGHAVGQAAANVVAVSQAGALPAGAGVLPFLERPPRAGRSLSPRGPHTTLSGGVLGNGPRRGRQAGDAVRGQGHLPSESPPESAGGCGAGGPSTAAGWCLQVAGPLSSGTRSCPSAGASADRATATPASVPASLGEPALVLKVPWLVPVLTESPASVPGRRVVSVISGSHGSTVPVPVSRPLTWAFRDPSDTEHVTLTL